MHSVRSWMTGQLTKMKQLYLLHLSSYNFSDFPSVSFLFLTELRISSIIFIQAIHFKTHSPPVLLSSPAEVFAHRRF